MAESIKLNGNKYIDADGVWDSTVGKTQKDINNAHTLGTNIPVTEGFVCPSDGYIHATVFNGGNSFILFTLGNRQVVVPSHVTYNNISMTYVKKGMTVNEVRCGAPNFINFIPIE